MIPVFTGFIKDGYILHDNATKYLLHIKGLEGQRIEVVVRKQKSKRSLSQNSYYWSVVIEILSKELGYDQDELHEILKYKFLKTHSNGMEYVKSTTKLTTGEFEDYLEKIRRWSADFLNINVPLPNEVESA
jgi:dihydroorotate dehydrogenase